MKLIITGSAILASVVNAGLSTISEDLGLLVAQNSSMWDDRSITAMLGNMGSVIDTYGCWCYFDEKHGQGKGHPVNSIDKICRDMAHGYDCAIMDAAADGDNDCVPWEVNYVGGSGQGLDNLVANCDANNANVCEAAACKIEGNFVLTFFQMFLLSGIGSIDNAFNHESGYDPVVNCPMVAGMPDSDRECCGEQPFRYMYKPFGGAKECCGSTVFSAAVQQCCPDNVPRISC